jgi:hypothetical protein
MHPFGLYKLHNIAESMAAGFLLKAMNTAFFNHASFLTGMVINKFNRPLESIKTFKIKQGFLFTESTGFSDNLADDSFARGYDQ